MIDPRLLLLDMTPLGGSAATGALKSAYFGDWRADALLQIQAAGDDRLAVDCRDGPPRAFDADNAAAQTVLDRFRPEVVLYRPVADHPPLHRFAKAILGTAEAPYALWLMDDWPERLCGEDPVAHAAMERDLTAMAQGAAVNFAISPGMADAFRVRYGAPFAVARNGVTPSDWPAGPCEPTRKGVLLRYAGSLAPDTTLASVLRVAETVSALVEQRVALTFEIRTQRDWLQRFGSRFAGLAGVSLSEANVSPGAYRRWLAEADIVLVAYNFDEETRRYLRYSFANKVPEALASGAAVLAFGPDALETIAYLEASQAAAVVTDGSDLAATLSTLVADPDRRRALGAAGRAHAFAAFDLDAAKTAMRNALCEVAQRLPPDFEAAQDDRVQFDECAFVFHALDAERACGVMLDVGAHEGAALLPFARASWRVIAFEPDAANRRLLARMTDETPGVTIRPEAVGAEKARDAPFYRSSLSSGASALNAFHETHVEADRVEVTTLDDVMREEGLERIDFLKIDVEGHEKDVLDGFDLAGWRPRALVVEFEDAKTVPRGYAMRDLADRLVEANYQTWVSEWRPIARYGEVHAWRRLRRYPCDVAQDAWGNLIGLAEEIAPDRFGHAFAAALRGGPAGEGACAAATGVAGPPVERSVRLRLSRWIWSRFPGPALSISKTVRAARRRLHRP